MLINNSNLKFPIFPSLRRLPNLNNNIRITSNIFKSYLRRNSNLKVFQILKKFFENSKKIKYLI